LSDALTDNRGRSEQIERAAESPERAHDEGISTVATRMAPSARRLARLGALLLALRPKQWTKNLAVFVGILFAQRLLEGPSFAHALLAFVAFCLAASFIYLLNDLLDLENDRRHPRKRSRPLASGRLPVSWAVVAMGVLLLLCAGLTSVIFVIPLSGSHLPYRSLGGGDLLFTLTLLLYLVLMVCYSVRPKHVVLLDVFIIASGFVLRILAGAVVISVVISPWLYLVAILLSLFLALSKRRHELVLLQGDASTHRQILKEYSLPLLDQMITVTAASTVMAYSLYTFQGPTGNHRLMVTIPLVLYGMFRYLYLVHMRMGGGSPEEVLLHDRHMLATVVLCTVIIIVILYGIPS
jgi:4-hydroxybenzoate polyprenyltransferase